MSAAMLELQSIHSLLYNGADSELFAAYDASNGHLLVADDTHLTLWRCSAWGKPEVVSQMKIAALPHLSSFFAEDKKYDMAKQRTGVPH